jgi:Tfp pilus assembly protein PilN
MLKSVLRHRPKQLVAVYAESLQVEVLRAHRHWRTWQVGPTERFVVPEGENLYDYLQRLNLRPRGKKGTALVLFLPRSHYSFHREHYPAALGEHLEEALAFDWQENAFHENGRSLHFFGRPVPVNRHLSVPIFSLQRDVYEKFQQALGSTLFETFAIIPTALIYQTFFTDLISEGDPLPLEILARRIGRNHMEIHRFYNRELLDSTLIGKNLDYLRLFRESLHCTGGNGECQEKVHIHVLCASNEATEEYAGEWADEDLPLRVHSVRDSFLSIWLKHLLKQDQVQTFEEPLILKPWRAPRFVWLLLLLVGIYAVFGALEVRSLHQLQEASKRLAKQNAQLETQWKPIEQLQTRIAKFQEDQKTLSEFNLEGYPLLEILTLLTQMTPDDTWLNYMSLKKGQLMLRGESKSAIKYLSDLAKVDGFGDVRFASPVTRNPASDLERFNVQLQLDADKLRKTLESVFLDKMDDTDKSEIDNLGESPAAEPLTPDRAPRGKPLPEVGPENEPEPDSQDETQ